MLAIVTRPLSGLSLTLNHPPTLKCQRRRRCENLSVNNNNNKNDDGKSNRSTEECCAVCADDKKNSNIMFALEGRSDRALCVRSEFDNGSSRCNCGWWWW